MMNHLRRLRDRLCNVACRIWTLVAPGTVAWRGASIGMVSVALLLALVNGYSGFSRYAWWSFPAYVIGLLLLLLFAGGISVWLLHWLARWPRPFVGAVIVTIPLLMGAFTGSGQRALLFLTPFVLITAAFTGAAVSSLWQHTWQQETAVHRFLLIGGLLVGGIGLMGGVGWLLWPGVALQMPPNAALLAWENHLPHDSQFMLANPSQPGEYVVKTLTYGSGTDNHRPEFGATAALITESVNGSRFVSGWTKLRTLYWGFDAAALPRNGRVWYPDGDGPFPLVFVVHGNHNMDEFSDPGYRYLGELLASRGFIVVSVDENFLNASAVADWLGNKGLTEENDARGWLLLEHLRLWRSWNAATDNPFSHKVDLDHIALIGHSRGGEAVAAAAAFNRLSRYPDNAAVRFDYGFNIRAVVAIAPVDGQYKPADTGIPLRNVHYLVLQGSHDMDVTTFMGQQQYDRVQFDDGGDWFKAAVYVYGANHGQFNTVWGNTDHLPPSINLFNRGQLLPAAAQQQIAQVFISAFLETTLHETAVYTDFFRDYRLGVAWLPDTIYLTRYEDAQMQFVTTYEEDIDVTTTTLRGGLLSGRYLTTWREEDVTQKGRDLETHAVVLGWQNRAETNPPPAYTITLPPALSLSARDALVFSLADAGPVDSDESTPRQPLDLHIEVEDSDGETAVLPLSHVSFLQPQLEAQLMKLAFLRDAPTSEVVFQSFAFPLADFAAMNPQLQVAKLVTVSLLFDQTPSGRVVLDNLGFRQEDEDRVIVR